MGIGEPSKKPDLVISSFVVDDIAIFDTTSNTF